MTTATIKPTVGKILYAALFTLVLPLSLIWWAAFLDRLRVWPMPDLPWLAMMLMLFGLGLIAKGMLDLYIYGKGLPMNAYPPPKLVTEGVYAWLAHPIYIGSVFAAAGLSLWLQSSNGLYVITPIVGLLWLSLFLGYERSAMSRLFGQHLVNRYQPLFGLPQSLDDETDKQKRLAMLLRIFLPWLFISYLIDYGRVTPSDQPFALVLARLLSMLPFAFFVWKIVAAPTQNDLRQATIAGTIATVANIYLRLILLTPEFVFFTSQWTRLFVSLILVLAAANFQPIWMYLQFLSEKIANSRRDWLFGNGRFRIINHSLYSGLGGFIGFALASYVIGNHSAVLIIIVCIVVGGATIAQVWWGNEALLRPFGYWGGVIGGIAGIFIVKLFYAIPVSQVALGLVLCAPFTQAVGRLRCLVQGCCHGLATQNKLLSIRVWQPQSRVVTLSGLKGQYILNTQLFSILFNLLLGGLLWRLWLTRLVGDWGIVGVYSILTGLERFTEDAYRGETQTRSLWGMRENQWVAIAAFIVGVVLTMIPITNVSYTAVSVDLTFWLAALSAGLFVAFALSMDFPKSTLRFSRLSG